MSAARGNRVFLYLLLARRGRSWADKLMMNIESQAARALVDRIDAVAEFGLDVLIHNAGVVAGGHDTFDQA